jgi:hypothetical protein
MAATAAQEQRNQSLPTPGQILFADQATAFMTRTTGDTQDLKSTRRIVQAAMSLALLSKPLAKYNVTVTVTGSEQDVRRLLVLDAHRARRIPRSRCLR